MKRYITIISFVFAVTAVTVSVYLFVTRPKTAYVNLTRLYSEFELKKQLEQQLTTVQQIRQKTIDSLELSLNMMSRNIQAIDPRNNKEEYRNKAAEFENRRQEFAYRKKAFTDDNAAMTEQYSSQIWKQLNQYVKDYGDTHNYTYIMGGDGSGSMMYADQAEDLTETLVVYTNERYKGEARK